MSIELTFLGTSGNLPTKTRNHTSVHLKFLNHNVLFDCGEGVQRQLAIAGLSNYRVDAVFISSGHADHVLGLGGLIQTQSFLGRREELLVCGPRAVKRLIDFYAGPGFFEEGNYGVRFVEAQEGVVFDSQDFFVTAFPQKHSCQSFGYVFEEKTDVNLDVKKLEKLGLADNPACRVLKEKGAVEWKGKTIRLGDVMLPKRRGVKIAYCVETEPVEKAAEFVKNADVLVCETTYAEDLRDQAHAYGHMTAKDAARLAKKAKADKLVLTHYSARYDDEKALEAEAKEIFKNTVAAKDFTRIML